MRKFFILLIMTTLVALTGCLKEGADTIALPLGKIPDGVIPIAIRDQFEQYMPIYEGIAPPRIVGEYLAQPLTLVFTSDYNFDVGHVFAPQYFAFESQSSSGMARYKERQGGGETEAPNVYVVGEGNNFTAYFISTSANYSSDGELRSTSKMSTIMSGTLTNEGISNYRYAFIMLEKDDPNHILMEVNEYRVFEDGDGLVDLYDWAKSIVKEGDFTTVCSNNYSVK